jgi:lipocalin
MAKMLPSSHQIFLSVVFQIIGHISCQNVFPGICPSRTATNLINLKEIHGIWHELERSAILPEFAQKCVSMLVNQFYNQQSQVMIRSVNRFSRKKIHKAYKVQADADFHHTGKITRLSQNDTDVELENFSFQILSTDYRNYLILWGCQNFISSAHSESLWIFGRKHHLSNAVQSTIMEQIRDFGLSHLKLQPVHQSHCSEK